MDRITKAAFGIIKTLAPSLSPKIFLEELRDEYDQNLSNEENKEKMMEAIRNGKLGKRMAEAASYECQSEKTFEELLNEVESQTGGDREEQIDGETEKEKYQ